MPECTQIRLAAGFRPGPLGELKLGSSEPISTALVTRNRCQRTDCRTNNPKYDALRLLMAKSQMAVFQLGLRLSLTQRSKILLLPRHFQISVFPSGAISAFRTATVFQRRRSSLD